MTLQQFITKWTGKPCDFDGAYGNQCVDLYRMYVKEVLNYPQSPGVAGAKDIWNNYLKTHFKAIPNTPEGIPKPGDIMIWGATSGNVWGHVGIVVEASLMSFKSFDQNFPTGSLPRIVTHKYVNLLGWLTPLSSKQENMAGNYYKGYDLLNQDSMKVAVDHLVDILEGRYVKSSECDSAIKVKTDDLNAKVSGLEDQLSKKQSEITTLKGELAEKASALKEVRDQLNSLMETLATKLTTIVDRSEIIGAVDRLLSGEHEMLKKVQKLEKAYALLEDEKKLEIEALKRELEQLRLVNETQAKHLERLGAKIDTVVEETKKTRTLYDVLKDFLNKFVETRED